jgi:gliding motility-associated lipoprotein GldB
MKKIIGIVLVAIVGLSSCESDSEEKCAFIPDVKPGSVNVKIESLEAALPAIKTKQDLVDFFSKHPQLRDEFFSRQGYPNDSIFINTLYDRFTSPHIDTLLMETQKIFGDLSELKEEFSQAFANIQFYYPDFQPPKIQTVISGLETDLLVSDTLIVVGLDYFLGAGAKYKPNMYGYMQRRYTKNFIVPSVLLLYGIDEHFNKTKLTDKTVLADMIAYGKAYYFAKHMLPCVPDSVFIGYTKEELQGAKDNEDLVYIRLVENEVLYSTSYQIKQKYIAERPKTLEVGEKCPGRIGTWVGWRIMDTYAARHPETTLAEMMNQPDAEKIFKESKYRPEKK